MTLAKTTSDLNAASIEKVLLEGDLASLRPDQRLAYYQQVCENLGLDPLTRPFQYIVLNRKLTLYASKACTDQLRTIRGVSITSLDCTEVSGCYTVIAHATSSDGRTDTDMGSVPIDGLRGDNLCNAMKKAVTQAKRRVTLSLCGLGMLDETETTQIKGAVLVDAEKAEAFSKHVNEDQGEASLNSYVVDVHEHSTQENLYLVTVEYPATDESGERIRSTRSGQTEKPSIVTKAKKYLKDRTPVIGKFRRDKGGKTCLVEINIDNGGD